MFINIVPSFTCFIRLCSSWYTMCTLIYLLYAPLFLMVYYVHPHLPALIASVPHGILCAPSFTCFNRLCSSWYTMCTLIYLLYSPLFLMVYYVHPHLLALCASVPHGILWAPSFTCFTRICSSWYTMCTLIYLLYSPLFLMVYYVHPHLLALCASVPHGILWAPSFTCFTRLCSSWITMCTLIYLLYTPLFLMVYYVHPHLPALHASVPHGILCAPSFTCFNRFCSSWYTMCTLIYLLYSPLFLMVYYVHPHFPVLHASVPHGILCAPSFTCFTRLCSSWYTMCTLIYLLYTPLFLMVYYVHPHLPALIASVPHGILCAPSFTCFTRLCSSWYTMCTLIYLL